MTDVISSVEHASSVMISRSVHTVENLIDAGLLSADRRAAIERVASVYAVAMTPEMANLIDRADAADPIARQFVPTEAELSTQPDERADPIGDDLHAPLRGIVHRYPDRVLLTPTHSCPVYCRFCFRRTRVGPKGKSLTTRELSAAYDYIRARPEIFEVIVTGGDPLLLSPRRIRAIVEAVSAIEHVGVIRFHTRVPIVDPGRITEALVAAMTTEKGLFLSIHANHPKEFTAAAAVAIRRLASAGMALVGQTVLLRGVNDTPETLTTLFREMVKLRIKPYYLHHLDLAPGTASFRTTLDHGRTLVAGLRGHISGLCQPCYVLDLPGGFGKVPIGPSYLSHASSDGDWLVTDYNGKQHIYPPPVV